MTEAELIKRHPLKVQFPGLWGRGYVLVWWNHSEQHHVIFAKTTDQVEHVYRTMLEKPTRSIDWSDAEPRRFYAVEVRSPTYEMRLSHAKRQQEAEESWFYDWVASGLKGLADAGEPLPSYVARCVEYKLPEDYHTEEDEWMREEHYDCVNCKRGLVFKMQDFYPRLRETWVQERGYEMGEKGGPSKAPEAMESNPLFTVQDRHGHHSDGTVLDQVKKVDGEFWFSNEIKFFCHAQELPVPESIKQLRLKLDQEWEDQKKRREEEHEVQMQNSEKKALGRLKEIFGG